MPKEKLVIDGPVSYFEEVPLKHGFTVKNSFSRSNMSISWEEKEGDAKHNRKRIYMYFGFDNNIIHMWPQHEDKVSFVDERDTGLKRCDALVTESRKVILEICPADCYPIIVSNSNRDFLALIHGGLRPLQKGIIGKTMRADVFNLLERKNFFALIGPGIRECCYRFSPLGFFLRVIGNPRLIKFSSWKRRSLDLLGFIINELKRVGIPEGNIIYSDVCTSCSKRNEEDYLFFSHRRAVRTGEKEGRFLALASLV